MLRSWGEPAQVHVGNTRPIGRAEHGPHIAEAADVVEQHLHVYVGRGAAGRGVGGVGRVDKRGRGPAQRTLRAQRATVLNGESQGTGGLAAPTCSVGRLVHDGQDATLLARGVQR